MQDETAASTTSGYPMLVVLPVTILTGVAGAALLSGVAIKILSLVVAVLALICLAGFYMVAPNEGRVLQQFFHGQHGLKQTYIFGSFSDLSRHRVASSIQCARASCSGTIPVYGMLVSFSSEPHVLKVLPW